MYAYVGEVNITMQKHTVRMCHWAHTQDSPRKTILVVHSHINLGKKESVVY